MMRYFGEAGSDANYFFRQFFWTSVPGTNEHTPNKKLAAKQLGATPLSGVDVFPIASCKDMSTKRTGGSVKWDSKWYGTENLDPRLYGELICNPREPSNARAGKRFDNFDYVCRYNCFGGPAKDDSHIEYMNMHTYSIRQNITN